MRDSRCMTLSYARRQQWRRLMTAASRAAGAVIALVAAALATAAEEVELGLLCALLSGVFALASHHSLGLAARSRVGAESEAQVCRALEPLVREGWRVEHAVDWPSRGDIDHVLRSPSGMGFVIETKTLRYSRAHVVRTLDAARWLARKRRRYPCGVLPIVCLTLARRVERFEEQVLVVSLDRLMRALRQTHAPSVADRGRHDDRTSAIRLTTTQHRVDDRIEGEHSLNRSLAVVSGRAVGVGRDARSWSQAGVREGGRSRPLVVPSGRASAQARDAR